MEKNCGNLFSRLPKNTNQTHPCPWLLVSHGKRYEFHTFYNISKDEYIKRNIPEFRHKQVSTTSYGWLLLIDYTRKPLNCCLINITSKEKIELPSIESESDDPRFGYSECILSKPPTDSDCHILLCASCGTSLLYCRVGDEKFMKRSQCFENECLITATSFKGKIYAWMGRSRCLVEVDFVNQDLLLKRLVNKKGQFCQMPQPSPANELKALGYLIESCSELLFVHSGGYSISGGEDYFRIFK